MDHCHDESESVSDNDFANDYYDKLYVPVVIDEREIKIDKVTKDINNIQGMLTKCKPDTDVDLLKRGFNLLCSANRSTINDSYLLSELEKMTNTMITYHERRMAKVIQKKNNKIKREFTRSYMPVRFGTILIISSFAVLSGIMNASNF